MKTFVKLLNLQFVQPAAFDRHFPGMKEKYQNRYGYSYTLISPNNAKLMNMYRQFCKENNMLIDNECFDFMKEFPENVDIGSRPVQGEFNF